MADTIKIPFCTFCGKKMKLYDVEVPHLEIVTDPWNAWWIDASMEDPIQRKEGQKLKLRFNDMYSSEYGLRLKRKMAFCPRRSPINLSHDIVEIIAGVGGSGFTFTKKVS